MRGRGGGLGGLALVAVAALVTPAAAGAQEAGRTCNGRAVTIAFDDPGVGTNINGTGGPDVILGGPDPEVIKAGGGDDVVCGGDGVDRIDGQGGRDQLLGQGDPDVFTGADLGIDLLNGGSRGGDTASYTSLPSGVGVQVDLTSTTAHMDGAPLNGTIVGIEVVHGTGSNDVLVGSTGDDQLLGRNGNDTIDGRGGSNTLDGGPGIDAISYAAATSGVNVNLGSPLVVRATTEDEIADFESAIGSSHRDRLVGTGDENELRGGGGDDTIKGKGGDDILQGGNGDDVLFPGGGDDFVDGGANDPVTSSGEHGDLVSYHGDTLDPGAIKLEVGLYFFAPTNSPPYAEGVGDDSLSGIESVRGVKNGRNHVQGDDGPNVIIGGDGMDFLNARGGNDLVYGLGGADILNGDYAAHENDAVFGNDYLDGGAPNGPGDPDRVLGNKGDDTCTGATDDNDHLTECETTF